MKIYETLKMLYKSGDKAIDTYYKLQNLESVMAKDILLITSTREERDKLSKKYDDFKISENNLYKVVICPDDRKIFISAVDDILKIEFNNQRFRIIDFSG